MIPALGSRKWLRGLLLLSLIFGLIRAPLAALGDGQSGNPVYLPLVRGRPGQPEPGASSQDLIEKAEAEKRLDKETALLYKVYAVFGDPRLPAEFRGDDSQMLDSMVMFQVQDQWNTLSTQAQAILLPYILPPDSPAAGGLSAAGPAENSPTAAWPKVSAVGGKALIWYPPNLANGAALANGLKTALETRIWEKLTGLMGTQPMSDLGSPQQVGPNGALDIYIVANMPGARGLAIPLQRAVPPTGAGCESWPTYIKIRAGALGGDRTKGMVQILAHEFMHSLQFSTPTQEACSEYDWLREATATWTMEHTYPLANSEQDYARDFLDHPDLALEDLSANHEYGAYLLPFFLTNYWGEPALVRTMFENARTMDSLAAIDKAIPGIGFNMFWGYFSAMIWNRAPFGEMFQKDSLTYQLEPEDDAPVSVTVPGGETIYELDLEVKHLSSRFYHYKFDDNSASLVTFFNGYNSALKKLPWEGSDFALPDASLHYASQDLDEGDNKGASVTALVKIAGKEWDMQVWSFPGRVAFCRDKADERLEELVIILGSHDYQDRASALTIDDQPPVLWASNVGCARWSGTASYTRVEDGVTETAKATGVVYEDFFKDIPNRHSWYSQTYPDLYFKLAAASVNWKISGTDAVGCTYSGSGSFEGYHEEYGGADLFLFPGLLSGPSYRGLAGFGKPAPGTEFSVHVACPDRQYDTLMGVTEFLLTDLEKLNTYSADGRTMQGSYTFEDYNGVHTYEWNLAAERE